MAISNAATNLLSALLPEWHLLLQGWSADGRLTTAAQEALLLNGEPGALSDLTNQWSAGEFGALPPIVLLVQSSYLACCQFGVGEQPGEIFPLISSSIHRIQQSI